MAPAQEPLPVAEDLMLRFADLTGLTGEAPPRRYLWTDAFAVCSAICSLCPRYAPRCLASAIPSRWRSRIRGRSNSANAPMTESMK